MQRQKSVLIADDSALLRKRVKQLVETVPCCHILDEASDGIEATNLIFNRRPDILILDIKMPFSSGIEVLKNIQSVIDEITVIVLTNQTSKPYQAQCSKLGADYFLDKSNDFFRLTHILNR